MQLFFFRLEFQRFKSIHWYGIILYLCSHRFWVLYYKYSFRVGFWMHLLIITIKKPLFLCLDSSSKLATGLRIKSTSQLSFQSLQCKHIFLETKGEIYLAFDGAGERTEGVPVYVCMYMFWFSFKQVVYIKKNHGREVIIFKVIQTYICVILVLGYCL